MSVSNHTTLLTLTLVSILFSPLSSMAENSYRDPGSMNADDRNAFIQAELSYGECLRERSLANLEQEEDIRRIADIAIQKCNTTVKMLEENILDRGFSPQFAQMYSTRMVRRVSKRFLPGLMQLKAGG